MPTWILIKVMTSICWILRYSPRVDVIKKKTPLKMIYNCLNYLLQLILNSSYLVIGCNSNFCRQRVGPSEDSFSQTKGDLWFISHHQIFTNMPQLPRVVMALLKGRSTIIKAFIYRLLVKQKESEEADAK